MGHVIDGATLLPTLARETMRSLAGFPLVPDSRQRLRSTSGTRRIGAFTASPVVSRRRTSMVSESTCENRLKKIENISAQKETIAAHGFLNLPMRLRRVLW